MASGESHQELSEEVIAPSGALKPAFEALRSSLADIVAAGDAALYLERIPIFHGPPSIANSYVTTSRSRGRLMVSVRQTRRAATSSYSCR
jgi:hypothetical protein